MDDNKDLVTIHLYDLETLLEYAYYGLETAGTRCHKERQRGCPICDALMSAELLVMTREAPNPLWWMPKTRIRRLLHRILVFFLSQV